MHDREGRRGEKCGNVAKRTAVFKWPFAKGLMHTLHFKTTQNISSQGRSLSTCYVVQTHLLQIEETWSLAAFPLCPFPM